MPPEKTFFMRAANTMQLPQVLFGTNFIRPYKKFVDEVKKYESKYAALSADALSKQIFQHRALLSMKGLTDDLIAETFALIKQVCARTMSITPYDTQLIGARMMFDGRLAEMATGEGKTLTAGMAAAAAALAGIPVHLMTANDYLVERDAETLKPLYSALGLTISAVTQSMEAPERQAAYACDITYCTAKEVVFDYLRDRIATENLPSNLHLQASKIAGKAQTPRLLRGLYMGIIDEADSILIDEARVPLILSKSTSNEAKINFFSEALNIAKALVLNKDFNLNLSSRYIELTDAGRENVITKTQSLSAVWRNRVFWEEALCQALAALHLYEKDRQYLVDETGVQIVDEITGRVSPGRVWSKGLHQMIELKEGCKITGELETMTQITYQRFFPRYLRLGGMSGTLAEARSELFNTYHLLTKKVPLRSPSQRRILPTRLFKTQQAQLQAAVLRIKEVHTKGQPVLIGTDSVADSEALSRMLTKENLPHQVLNARQNAEEADIVAKAGMRASITVSTNMAGRGTDIPLAKEMKSLGGLHVISCQHNVSKRIDRQLIGRAARQGDPGSAETFSSLDKLFIYNSLPTFIKAIFNKNGLAKPVFLVKLMVAFPQWLHEYNQRAQREDLLRQDALTEKNLSSMGGNY